MRAVIVTGVSRGLGAELLARFAADGRNRVLGIGRSFPPAGRFTPYAVDLASLGDDAGAVLALGTALDAVLAGATDAVICLNAGVVEPVGAVGTAGAADLARSVAVNLTATMIVADRFVAALPVGVPATVLFVSSGAATRVIAGWAPYCAAKAGAEMYFRVLAAERPDITVRSVNPGRMDTGMQAVLRNSDFPDRASYIDAHERGDLASPAQVAARIISEHVTGT